MSTNTKEITDQLHNIIESYPNTIKAMVAQEALDYDDISAFFNDLLQHGCQSGMITSLIYYDQTHEFFDNHYDEIEDLREEYCEQTGEHPQPQGDLKNWYAWFAFEETAYRMAMELNIA